MLHPFLYQGKRYNSKSELLRALEKEFKYIDTSFVLFGKKYNSLQEVARDFNINFDRLKAGYKRTNDLEFIVTRMKSGKALGLYSVDFLGNEFSSASELCRYWKIKRSTYFHRLYLGDDLESLIMGKSSRQKIKFLNTHKEFFTQKQFDFYMDKYAKEVK